MARSLGNGWKTMFFGSLEAQILSFGEGSEYGICGGRISKLWIRDNNSGKVVCNYDRGWDVQPAEPVKRFYYEILEKYN